VIIQLNPSRSLRYPRWKQGNAGGLLRPLWLEYFGVQSRQLIVYYGNFEPICCPVHPWATTPQVSRILRDRVWFSRRLKLTSVELAMLPLSQASPLGGLHRASRVPFRVSCFTSDEHPSDATTQRLIVCLYRRWSYRPVKVIRSFQSHAYVAHIDEPETLKVRALLA
jgi:hypothetical protein